MLTRLCDRCQAPADAAEPLTSTKTLVIPVIDPSTRPVTADCEVSIGILIAPQDLCVACQGSALVEYALARLGPALTPAVLRALSLRINAVTGFTP